MEVIVPRKEQSKTPQTEDKPELSRCSKVYGTSKRKAEKNPEHGHKKNCAVRVTEKKREVREIYQFDNIKPKLEAKEDSYSQRTKKLPCKRRDEKQNLTVSNKKRKYKDDFLNDDLEDEEMLILLKAKSRSRSRRMNNAKVTIFLHTLNRW